MAVDLMAFALAFMSDYGLYAIFVLLVLDGAMLLPAVPGEVVLVLAVSQYGTTLDGFLLVFGIAVVAAMVGSTLLYAIGRSKTAKPGQKRKKVFGMSPRRQEKMERLFSRPTGQVLLFFGRLFPLTRIIVSLPAGIARMPFLRFFVISIVGTIAFYAGFLWLTYEFKDPNSQISLTAEGVKAAYATPAMEYIEANWILTGAIVLVVGIILSIRASMRMARDHEETGGSLVGTLATAVLFWGGAAVLALLWLDAQLLFRFIELGGIHPEWLSPGLPYEPLSTIAGVATVSMLFALIIRSARRHAKRRNRELQELADRVTFEEVEPAAPAPAGAADTQTVSLGVSSGGPPVQDEPSDAAPGDATRG